MIRISALFVVLLLAASCNQKSIIADNELNNSQNVINTRVSFDKLPGKWTFTGYLKDTTVPSNGEATLEFTTTETANKLQVGGRSFINLYSTTFTYNEANSTIQLVEPIGMTKMAGSPDLMKAETNFLNNLKNVTKFSVDGAVLKLYVGEPAVEIMSFTK
ncbi:META domain-containing protein [Runella sp.]|uniref:META domain-containing protein n=1 Tax=Runella sp. TaxID=1960881 RepID=UPI003D151AEF